MRLPRFLAKVGRREGAAGAVAVIALNVFGSTTFSMYQAWWRSGRALPLNVTDLGFVAASAFALVAVLEGVYRLPRPFVWRAALGATGLQWAASQGQAMLASFSTGPGAAERNMWEPLFLAFAIAASLVAYRGLFRSGKDRLEVVEQIPARAADGLIVFLSNPAGLSAPLDGRPRQVDELLAIEGDLRDPATLDKFGSRNWRMPFEAVAYHLKLGGRLSDVVVITSADSAGPSGTWRVYSEFKRLAEKLIPEDIRPEFRQLDEGRGSNFESAASLSDAITRAKAYLDQACAAKRILVDATGGTALCSTLAAGLSFDGEQAFEYVRFVPGEPSSYFVEEFNIVYKEAPKVSPTV